MHEFWSKRKSTATEPILRAARIQQQWLPFMSRRVFSPIIHNFPVLFPRSWPFAPLSLRRVGNEDRVQSETAEPRSLSNERHTDRTSQIYTSSFPSKSSLAELYCVAGKNPINRQECWCIDFDNRPLDEHRVTSREDVTIPSMAIAKKQPY